MILVIFLMETRENKMEFNKENVINILNSLNLDENIDLIDIPQIDLYMDQVIQLFESNLSGTKRNKEDKLLTKTMINNYSKDKILLPVKNKKYSRNHVILMILIYNLKQSLSISDIKGLFSNLVSDLQDEKLCNINLPKLYEEFLEIKKEENIKSKDYIEEIVEKVEETINNDKNKGYEELLLTVFALINGANIQRRLAEKIIDNYFNNHD